MNDMRVAERDTPAWEEAWGRLKEDMQGLRLRTAWRKLRTEVANNPSYPTQEAKDCMLAVLSPDVFDLAMPNVEFGESWQYMGTVNGEYTDSLTGKKLVGWHHQFRHRAMPGTNERMYRFYGASKVPAGPEPVLVVHRPGKFTDNGQPF